MKLLTPVEVQTKLVNHPDWEFDAAAERLVSELELEDFHSAAEFVHMIADLADEIGHHPDLHLHDYKFLTIMVSTHDPKGITEKDFTLIEAIDGLFEGED